MDRDGVLRWVAGYERAWREGGVDAVAELFTEPHSAADEPG